LRQNKLHTTGGLALWRGDEYMLNFCSLIDFSSSRLTFKGHLFIFLVSLCFGYRFFQPTAYFFIRNVSKDKTPVDIQIKMGGQTAFDDIKYTNVRPDLQYTPSITVTEGKYTIFVTVNNGKTSMTQPIMLDGDRANS
jgi:hypothetical protein